MAQARGRTLAHPLSRIIKGREDGTRLVRHVLKHQLVNQYRNRVHVVSNCVATYARRFKRKRPAARERIHNKRSRTGCTTQRLMRGLSEYTTRIQILLYR